MAVGLQSCRIGPVAMGEKEMWIGLITPQIQVRAPLELPNLRSAFGEKLQKGVYRFGPKLHLDDADEMAHK